VSKQVLVTTLNVQTQGAAAQLTKHKRSHLISIHTFSAGSKSKLSLSNCKLTDLTVVYVINDFEAAQPRMSTGLVFRLSPLCFLSLFFNH